jgi:hypothetical protein
MTTTEQGQALLKATEAFLRSFQQAERSDGSRYWTLKDTAPEWAGDVVRALHHGELPNDWRYEVIVHQADEFFQALCEGRDADGACDAINTEPEVYSGKLLAWLQDNLDRVNQEEDLSPTADVFELISQAQRSCLWTMANQLQWQLEQVAAEQA